MAIDPYNPLEKRNLAESIQRRILRSQPAPLASQDARASTGGAGVYALYYIGSFAPYMPIAASNRNNQWRLPIYVGKAIPSGQRVGSGIESALTATRALSSRLRRHATSIEEVDNLEISDFWFRHLVVDDVFIPLGEAMLIETFQPLWNVEIAGFGSNPTGGPRAGQATSRWDTLHPGRGGAGQTALTEVQQVQDLVEGYCEKLHKG